MAHPTQMHHFGVQYYLLVLGAWVIRLSALIQSWAKQNDISHQTMKAANVTQTRILVPSRERGRSIKVDLYEKRDTPKNAKQHVHLNIHGSGFIVPSLGSDISFCTALAATGTVVFDADYRKAPEHPFPAAYEDAQDVLNYIRRRQDDFDITHVTVSGFSAGGNLAMALAVNSDPNIVAGIVSFYGNTDMTAVYPAPDAFNFDSGIIVPEWLRRFFYRCYILPHQNKADTRLSPAKATLDRWPKHVLMACGTADSLHESSRLVIDSLEKNGHRDAHFLSVEREAHGFDKNTKPCSSTDDRRLIVYREALDVIARAQQEP